MQTRLVLTRRVGESFTAEGPVTVTVVRESGTRLSLLVEAERDVIVRRLEPKLTSVDKRRRGHDAD